VNGIKEANEAAISLLIALRADDETGYFKALKQMLAVAMMDLAKKHTFGQEVPDHHRFLAPTPLDPLHLFILDLLKHNQAKAQLFQDAFVLWALDGQTKGYFVEIGAGDGITLSNTWLLEKKWDWNGLLVEPNPANEESLEQNRTATVDTRCIAAETGNVVSFACTDIPEFSHMISARDDFHSDTTSRDVEQVLERQTVSLTDLFQEHRVPNQVDYLSVDIEGMELEALSSCDFDRYDIKVITVEHNYREDTQQIIELLRQKGFVLVFPEFSRIEAWFIHQDSLPASLSNYCDIQPERPLSLDRLDYTKGLVELVAMIIDREQKLNKAHRVNAENAAKHEVRVKDVERRLHHEKTILNETTDMLEGLRTSYSSATRDISDLKGKVQAFEESMNELKAKNETLKDANSNLEHQLSSATKSLADLNVLFEETIRLRTLTGPLAKYRAYTSLLIELQSTRPYASSGKDETEPS